MKSTFLYLILFVFSLNANAQITKAEIVATGLTCSMCSNAINKQLKALAGVEKVETDLNTNTFTVFIKKDATITPRILKDRVEKAGFFVGSMVVTMSFENLKITDNLSVNENKLSLIFIDSKPKTLNGEVKLKILDKGFVTQKEFKKLSKLYAKYTSYSYENEDNYHIKPI